MFQRTRSAGFSRLDMLLIVALLLVLSFMMVPSMNMRGASKRDARRVEDMQRIEAAIARYWTERGSFPPAHESPAHDGWDVSNDGDFIPALLEAGYLAQMPADPRNDEQFQYRYRVFPKGSFGCSLDGPTYVLGVRAFETVSARSINRAGFRCPDRDFTQEFGWVGGRSAPVH